MKTKKINIRATVAVVAILAAVSAKAQFMPVVYDNTYGKGHEFVTMSADFSNGDIVLAGTNDGKAALTWIDREGKTRLFKSFEATDFETITAVIPMADDKVLVTGSASEDKKKKSQGGHAMVITSDGVVDRDLRIGTSGTHISGGKLLRDGGVILSGSTNTNNGTAGFVCRVSARNNVVYFYTAPIGTQCTAFDVYGSRSEYLHAAFSSDSLGSCVVRLDEGGKPYYVTAFTDENYVIENMVTSSDGYVYVAGHGDKSGGSIIKVRPEGDIVFNRTIVPAGQDASVRYITLLPSGEIFVGGHGAGTAHYTMLRQDGTRLMSNMDRGEVLAVANNLTGDQLAISIFDKTYSAGKIVRLSKTGRKLFEKGTLAQYTEMRFNGEEDLLMAAPATGRLSMISINGEMLFDRYVQENTPTPYKAVCLPYTGEAFFIGQQSNLVKLAHGIYVNDITVNKPIDGIATAKFTVNLTGFSFDADGTPRPVTVYYQTAPLTAKENLNFTSASGTLSFLPGIDGSDPYHTKFTVEVPVMANDLLEGDRTFELQLSNPTQSYIIRDRCIATITDQPAIVRMIDTKPGVEGQSNVTFELGLFKTNGVKITNATFSDIVIDGEYGRGSADRQDFDWGLQPRVIIKDGQHSGTFDVQTLEDTRYENIKTVVVDFTSVSAMSDANVSFASEVLSCHGQIYDQPAVVAIESLGDFNRQSNVVTPFFKISLLRASDGALQTNCSGSDIVLYTELDSATTAVKGTDFVFTNDYDLRIRCDERSSTANLNGLVLYSPDSTMQKVAVKLKDVIATSDAGALTICEQHRVASVNINNK